MTGNRRFLAAGTAFFATCWLALSPAVGGVDSVLGGRDKPVSLNALGSIASFTPVTSDERLARAYAQALTNARSQGLRFTPSVGTLSGRRSITIVVRAPDAEGRTAARGSSSPTSLGLGPVAYNLGAARGLQRFATEIAGSHEADPLVPKADLALPKGFSLEKEKRLSADVELESISPIGLSQQSATPQKSYAVDLASSYAVTRNLDLTAGVRYKGRANRLGPLTDDARDSQAIYLGTTFKF